MSDKPVTDRKYRQARRRSARKNAMNKLARNAVKKLAKIHVPGLGVLKESPEGEFTDEE